MCLKRAFAIFLLQGTFKKEIFWIGIEFIPEKRLLILSSNVGEETPISCTTVNEVKIENDKVVLSINKELAVEVVGNAKIKVPIEIVDDDYEEIVETSNDEVEVEVEQIDEVNEEYLD